MRSVPVTDGYMNRKQLAAYLGVNPNTVSTLVKTGGLPRPSGLTRRLFRWKREDVDNFLREKSKKIGG